MNLVPDHHREADARADHDHHREPEAERRQLPFVRSLFEVPALESLSSVLAVNGGRVEQIVLDLLPLRLSHARQSSAVGR